LIDRHVLGVKFNKSIHFNEWSLAPMAHTRFCLAYQDQCKVRKTVFRGGPIKLTAERRAELITVNDEVNRAITPEPNLKGLAGERWLIAPKSGECHDYAVSKRQELLARGWPARALLLSEVVTNWGKHHLVLVVRTTAGDVVADSLDAEIRTWTKTFYQWVRIQSPDNPLFWATVASTPVLAQLMF
jgi:predicted transglutaminase-like cysteine proteinase